MSGLKNTVKRFANASMFRGYKTNREIKQEKAAKVKAGKDAQYANAQVPDEEVIQRNERRKAAKRQGSRANTVMTQDRLG